MPTYATTSPAALVGGLPYATAVPLTSTEANLFDQVGSNVITVPYGQAILAVVTLTVSGGPTANVSYVVMQTAMADGTWVDVAWCRWTGILDYAIFALSAGVAGANALQQSRAAGTAPSSTDKNQIPLGGQVRFVGKATLTGWGSSNPGPGSNGAEVTATIYYRCLPLR